MTVSVVVTREMITWDEIGFRRGDELDLRTKDIEIEERYNDNNSTPATEIQLFDPVPENYEMYGWAGSVFGTVDNGLAISINGVNIWKGDDEYSTLYDPDIRTAGETSAVVKVRTRETLTSVRKLD